MSQTFELLQAATLCLVQAGLLKDRLAEAYAVHLSRIEPQQIPDALRTEYLAMCAAMQREEALPRDNPVRASIRKMSNAEVTGYATLIVRIYGAVARAFSGAGQSRTAPGGSLAPILQLVAAEG